MLSVSSLVLLPLCFGLIHLVHLYEMDSEMFKGSMAWTFSVVEEDEDDDRGAEDGEERTQGKEREGEG